MGARRVAAISIAVLASALALAAGTAQASTLTATVSPSPVQSVPATVTLTGTLDATDRPRELIVYVHDASWECRGALPDLWFGTTVLIRRGERPIGIGPFHETVAFVPPDVGTWRLCAYADRYDAEPLVFESSFEVGRAQAELSLAIAGALDTRAVAHVTVTGTAQARRYLTVNAVDRGTCTVGESAGGRPETVGPVWPDNRVGPSTFGQTFAWKPFYAGARELCATVWTESRAPGADALVAIPIDVVDGAADDAARRRAAEDAERRRQQDERDALARRRREDDERRRRERQPRREAARLPDQAERHRPGDGADGMLLNPVFGWAVSRRAYQWLPSEDVLTIAEVGGGGRVRPLLRATTDGFRTASPAAANRLRIATRGDTRWIARVGGPRGAVELRLLAGLPPGTYEWNVERGGQPAGAPWRFTVRAPGLRSLRVRRRDLGAVEWRQPGWATIELRAVPYTDIVFSSRLGGGRWRTFALDGHRGNRMIGYVTRTCSSPGGTFQWRLVARDAHGDTRVARGRVPNVAPPRCAALRRRDDALIRAVRQRTPASVRLAREWSRRFDELWLRRQRTLCRAAGGALAWRNYGRGRDRFCIAPGGGLLAVPTFNY